MRLFESGSIPRMPSISKEREVVVARKRKNLRDLDYETKEYWDALLREEGLSMDRGRHKKLSYVGAGSSVEYLHGVITDGASNRIEPKPQAE